MAVDSFLEKIIIRRELADGTPSLVPLERLLFERQLPSISIGQAAVDGFLEEMIIRRELADNFCFYEPNYDNLKCAAPWAMESLNKHRGDKREHLYNE